MCAALAAEAGATEIIVTDLQDAPLNIALKMGATRVINIAQNQCHLEQFYCDKGYFDVAFECSAV